MDQNSDELELFSNDIVKNEVVDPEDRQMRMTAGKHDKCPVKEETHGTSLIKNEVEDGEIGGCAKRGNPDFAKNPEPKRRKVTSVVETNIYISQKELTAVVKEEADAVQMESDQVDCSPPVAEEESVRGSFNAHDLFSNEAVQDEEDEVLDNPLNQDSFEKNCLVDGCFEKLPSYPYLVKHMKSHPSPVVCGFCKKSFAHPSLLRRHYASHTGEKNFGYHLCEYKAARRDTLKTHLRNHEKERPYPCTVYDKSFENSAELSRHLKNAEIKEEAQSFLSVLPIAEKEPDGSFNVQDLFSNEVATKEEEGESQIAADERKSCPVDGCLQTLPSFPDLVQHLKSHPIPVVCGVCEKFFVKPCHLRDHYIMHTGEKNFECHLCEYRAAKSYTLKTHLRNHEKNRPHPCTFCDKSFANSRELSRHLRIHTRECPFVCDTCGYRTTDSSCLKTHQRTHTGETPFPCTSCDKRFKSLGDLTRHTRTHTGEKPFSCKNCEFKTARSANLKAHQKKYNH